MCKWMYSAPRGVDPQMVAGHQVRAEYQPESILKAAEHGNSLGGWKKGFGPSVGVRGAGIK